jgi:hypothetical protein
MVCAEGEAASDAAPVASAATADNAVCDKMCPLHQPETGAICLISSNGEGTSIAAVLFIVAPPLTVETAAPAFVARKAVAEVSSRYVDPSLAGSTPPPKA